MKKYKTINSTDKHHLGLLIETETLNKEIIGELIGKIEFDTEVVIGTNPTIYKFSNSNYMIYLKEV